MTPTLSDDEIDADVEADDEADEQIQVVFPTGAAHGSRTPTSTTSVESQLCLLSASAAHQVLRHDLESIISRHFVEKYYRLILLPDGHPDFYNGWIGEIQDLMMQYKSMQYSVLTCAASHMHFIDTSPQMQELALTYYSKAIRGVSEILSHTSELENHNGLLMSVMLLYLHGVGFLKPFSFAFNGVQSCEQSADKEIDGISVHGPWNVHRHSSTRECGHPNSQTPVTKSPSDHRATL